MRRNDDRQLSVAQRAGLHQMQPPPATLNRSDVMSWIIAGLIFIILFVLFARSTAREATRLETEVDFRVQSLSANVQSLDHLLNNDDEQAEKAERKAAVWKARAEEVASRQSPAWKAYSRAVRKPGKRVM
jgi:biopolymer transport protein ExbB/TolQ